LTDGLWAAVAPVLPGKAGDPGCRGRDNRLFLEAVFWILRNGASWRNLPREYGKWYTAYTRYRRWEQKGVWPRVVEALRAQGAAALRHDATGLRWESVSAEPQGVSRAERAAA
jgi:transposase